MTIIFWMGAGNHPRQIVNFRPRWTFLKSKHAKFHSKKFCFYSFSIKSSFGPFLKDFIIFKMLLILTIYPLKRCNRQMKYKIGERKKEVHFRRSILKIISVWKLSIRLYRSRLLHFGHKLTILWGCRSHTPHPK